MRFLQNILLTIGVSASGAVAGALAAFLVLRALAPMPRGEAFGGGTIWLLCIACGLLLGAIAGFVGITSWVAQHDSPRWSRAIGIGIFLGLLVGVVISFTLFQRAYTPFRYLATALVSAACATLGGAAVGVVVRILRRDSKDIF